MKQFRRKVIHGQKKGREMGYPTLNFCVGSFGGYFSTGIYSCEVIIEAKKYRGGLYYGMKPNAKTATLEIHVIDFSGEIYGSWVTFSVERKIREPQTFENPHELRNQIARDMEEVLQ